MSATTASNEVDSVSSRSNGTATSEKNPTLVALFNKYYEFVGVEHADSKLRSMSFHILPLINDLLDDKENYIKHNTLKKFIEKNKLSNPQIDAYMVEFDDFMYELDGSSKKWRNSNGQLHRTSLDSNGMTKPARIDANGGMEWRKNGEYYRTDRDEFGNLLPTEITHSGTKFWNFNNWQHRAELGNNPNDEANFGKALPAIIEDNGKKLTYKYKGSKTTCEKLTKKLLAKRSKLDLCKLDQIAGLEITLKNGTVVKLHDLAQVCVLHTV